MLGMPQIEALQGLETPPLGCAGEEHFAISEKAYLLPIESFKAGSVPIRGLLTAGHAFKSSGTTGGGRSIAWFSETGMSRYKEAALTAFERVIANDEMNIVSMIPTVTVAPESSLARMLAFFADTWKVHYTTPANLSATASALSAPLCIFGTTAHYLDITEILRLPHGSMAIETGGLKTLSETLDRGALHRKIGAVLGIPQARILSEYGMAELASQAYGKKWLRFPDWVSVWVTRGMGRLVGEGVGALVVFDRARIDVPWPIRTQDIVNMKAGGAFEYLGRVPQAVLKGCALGAPS